MKKQTLVKLMSTAMVSSLVLTACGGGSTAQPSTDKPADQGATEENKAPQVLRLNINSEPPTLDPGLAEDSTSGTLIRQMFEGLTRIGEDENPHEAAAEKIEVSEDLKTYTFTIRENAKWSNGDPVTAYDFEYAWERVLAPETAANYAYQLYVIKNAEKFNKGEIKDVNEVGIKATDERTLVVELENPTPYFLELTAFYTYMPVNKNIVEANKDWANDATDKYVSNGAFKLDKWEHNNIAEIVKNDQYWDADKVQLDRITFAMIEDHATAFNMFENGELDWAGAPTSDLPTDAIPTLKDQGRLNIYPIAGTYWYKFQTEKPPFNNVKMRKAFAYAMDRQTIIDNVTQADQIPAMGAVPPTMGLKNEGYFKDNDLETAKKLFDEGLQELGMTKEELDVTLSYNTSESHQKIAQAIQDQWKKAFGIDVKLENMEWKVYLEEMHSGNYQVGRMGWLGDFNDPINFLELYKDKYGGNNDTLWENADFQRLLGESAVEADPDKRKQILAQAEQILMDEMPIAPIYFYTKSYVKDDKVKGVLLHGLGDVDYKYAYIE
ncbi:peptide ABC transporter substrate-binding protein [Ammoniphilus sp. CFH 90114]|uniref:peptide ABC transporter substrate-binding protein n=1 Tax=Ammoniphilus sp. CFH 90114 TaxID=2493665 RepID=UPI00100F0356|nr:peptide ABC transporter substrate-binding protein [Ammoniphilus sp. CFH 90114]RXT13832.1 peptide ABC transporter substrate-binding protein [Ammoniphilus sp. CFH 90114]